MPRLSTSGFAIRPLRIAIAVTLLPAAPWCQEVVGTSPPEPQVSLLALDPLNLRQDHTLYGFSFSYSLTTHGQLLPAARQKEADFYIKTLNDFEQDPETLRSLQSPPRIKSGEHLFRVWNSDNSWSEYPRYLGFGGLTSATESTTGEFILESDSVFYDVDFFGESGGHTFVERGQYHGADRFRVQWIDGNRGPTVVPADYSGTSIQEFLENSRSGAYTLLEAERRLFLCTQLTQEEHGLTQPPHDWPEYESDLSRVQTVFLPYLRTRQLFAGIGSRNLWDLPMRVQIVTSNNDQADDPLGAAQVVELLWSTPDNKTILKEVWSLRDGESDYAMRVFAPLSGSVLQERDLTFKTLNSKFAENSLNRIKKQLAPFAKEEAQAESLGPEEKAEHEQAEGALVSAIAETSIPWSHSAGDVELFAPHSRVELGKVDFGATAQLQFELINLGTSSVSISGLETECGCSAVSPLPSEVLAGETLEILIHQDINSIGHTDLAATLELVNASGSESDDVIKLPLGIAYQGAAPVTTGVVFVGEISPGQVLVAPLDHQAAALAQVQASNVDGLQGIRACSIEDYAIRGGSQKVLRVEFSDKLPHYGFHEWSVPFSTAANSGEMRIRVQAESFPAGSTWPSSRIWFPTEDAMECMPSKLEVPSRISRVCYDPRALSVRLERSSVPTTTNSGESLVISPLAVNRENHPMVETDIVVETEAGRVTFRAIFLGEGTH